MITNAPEPIKISLPISYQNILLKATNSYKPIDIIIPQNSQFINSSYQLKRKYCRGLLNLNDILGIHL